MSAHTPGPWGVEQTPENNWIGPMRLSGIWKVAAIVCHTDREGLKPEALARNDANARLIAAAPELLAACKALVDGWIAMDGDEQKAIDMARAAIAKAEGL